MSEEMWWEGEKSDWRAVFSSASLLSFNLLTCSAGNKPIHTEKLSDGCRCKDQTIRPVCCLSKTSNTCGTQRKLCHYVNPISRWMSMEPVTFPHFLFSSHVGLARYRSIWSHLTHQTLYQHGDCDCRMVFPCGKGFGRVWNICQSTLSNNQQRTGRREEDMMDMSVTCCKH